ncbi:MAG: acyl-CoA dehydrogenase family protein [bacterium]
MDFSLTEEQQLLQREIIRFAQQELNADAAERDRHEIFPHEQWLKCGQMKLQGLPIPEEYGGAELDPLSMAIALEALGYACHDSGLVFAIGAHLFASVIPIWKNGSTEQKRRYLPGLCNGTLIAANAMTEPNSGSDAFAMLSRAEAEGTGYRLQGAKIFISNAPYADLFLVFARMGSAPANHGSITGFLIDKGTPGLKVRKQSGKMGLRTAPLGEVVLEDVYVPSHAVLGEIGGGANIFMEAMDWERIGIFAGHVGTMARLLEKALQHARTRKQFGQTIGKFQAVAHRLADMKTQLEAARWLTYKAAWELDRGRAVSLEAAMTKLFVSESLVKAALDTVQIFGGYGFMAESEVERALRDAVGSTIYSGTSQMQRNIIAKWLGL